jgi:hypothetical protein
MTEPRPIWTVADDIGDLVLIATAAETFIRRHMSAMDSPMRDEAVQLLAQIGDWRDSVAVRQEAAETNPMADPIERAATIARLL